MRIGILASHPIQYHAPLYRALADQCELQVFFAHRQTPAEQGKAGYGVAFDWDRDLLSGYTHRFLDNRAAQPDVHRFLGCDTPAIDDEVRTGGFDAFLVAGWHLKTYWQAVAACRRWKVPVMVRGDSQLQTPRSTLKRWVKAGAYPWLLRRFDACLYVGQRNREYLQHYGVPATRLFFAPHCVDAAFFARAAAAVDRSQVRLQWGLDDRQIALLFVGRLVPFKRAPDLIEAAAVLRARGMPITVVIAGDGEQRSAIEATAHQRQVPLRLLGFKNQTELPAVYAAADVMVLPSLHNETWGLVINEALSCGTPCAVSTACGAAPDMIVPGITGATFAATDIEGMATAITQCLAIDRRSMDWQRHMDRYSPAAAAAGIQAAAGALGRRARGRLGAQAPL